MKQNKKTLRLLTLLLGIFLSLVGSTTILQSCNKETEINPEYEVIEIGDTLSYPNEYSICVHGTRLTFDWMYWQELGNAKMYLYIDTTPCDNPTVKSTFWLSTYYYDTSISKYKYYTGQGQPVSLMLSTWAPYMVDFSYLRYIGLKEMAKDGTHFGYIEFKLLKYEVAIGTTGMVWVCVKKILLQRVVICKNTNIFTIYTGQK